MPPIIPVTDPLDPRVAPFRAIRERDLVGRAGRFIAEGTVVLDVLLRATRHRAEALLIAENRLAGLAGLLARVPEAVPVYGAAPAVIDAIAGFNIHRGVLALGRRGEPATAEALVAGTGRPARILVLVGIANHDNVGGIFRNAAAFGADGVLLDAGCCDPLYRKAIRVSVGASLIVPFARLAAGEDGIALLARHGFRALALSPGGATELARLAPPERAAILLGTEGPGLPASLLARAESVRIPMAAGFDSLNVATVSGIVLHHLRR